MKTLTIVGNFVLLGLIGIGIITNGSGLGSGSLFEGLAIVAIITNLIMVSGSTVRMNTVIPGESSVSEGRNKKRSVYLFLKISAIILNTVLLAIFILEFRKGSGYLLPYFMAAVILTVLLSIVRIAIGRWNGFYGLNRTIFSAGIVVIFLLTGAYATLRIMVLRGIKEHVSIAMGEYPGNAEDALLAYLTDSSKIPNDRTRIAVWTLGQIRSEKALPVLNSLYRNDPEGLTCRHDSEVCQYELHKAIVLIERKWLGARDKNGRSKKNTGGYDKREALENFTACRKLADEWMKILDSTGYSHLLSIQSREGGYNNEISSYINDLRKVYGEINDRKLLGAHIYFYSRQSLFTYVPDIDEKYLAHIHADRSEDGFYIVEPKYFGLTSYRQMFRGFPEGDYVILMYKVSPANKSYAEERLTFLRARLNNPDRSWQIVDYKLANEI